jgi:hypothetical protein
MKEFLIRSASLICAVLIFCPALSFAENTDVVVLKNGGRIIGDIRKMDLGKLTYSTDEMKTVYIDWLEIARISSKHTFDIEMASGLRYQGSLGESGKDGKIVIDTRDGRATEDIVSVVNIAPLDTGFWQRFKGTLSLGFNYQKANSLATLTSSSDITLHTKKWELRLESSNYVSSQDRGDNVIRNSGSLSFNKFLPKRWTIGAVAQIQQNDELGLDLRTLFAGSFGRYLVKNNRIMLLGLAGLTFTNETYSGDEAGQYNSELLFSLDFQAFRYHAPDLNLNVSVQVYPSITDFGRVRIEFKTAVYYEIFKSFYLSVSLFDNYDSRPPAAVSGNDYGVDLSFSWKFY